MLFGLGPGELLILAALAVLIFGPKALPKMLRGLKTLHEARSKLTPRGIVEGLMNEEEPPKKKRKEQS